MAEILQTWIQARLGFMIDLGPEVFGHYTRDGRLLAQILYSYDVITRDQLNTIIETHDPALCRVNLKHLRLWLRFLGIDCDNESVEEISCGKGTTSLRLFYKVYLCLETKDRLHFITLQKEREKYVPTSKKFEVSTVCEDPPPYQPPEHPLCRKLVEGKEAIEWHRSKFPAILRKVTRERRKLQDWESCAVARTVDRCDVEKAEPVNGRKEESEELDRFARKHRVESKKLDKREEEEEEEEDEEEKEEDGGMAEIETAAAYVDRLKSRSKRAAIANALESKMQKTLLADLWDRMANSQERICDEAIADRVLNQAKYEKRIASKLAEVREQKNLVAENQKILEDMIADANELEYRASFEREKDLACKKQRDVDTECRRMCELRERLREEKARKIREKHWQLCRETVEDVVSLAFKIEDYRRVNDGHVSETILREWQTMFLKCQPIFDEEIVCELEADADEEDEERSKEEICRIKNEKIAVMRDALVDDYLETNPPWDSFAPTLGEDARETMELGRAVLGYVVHRLLNYARSDPTDRSRHAWLSKLKDGSIILGVANPAAHESLRALLESNEIRLARMEDAINYCLERYKEEASDIAGLLDDSTAIAATDKIVKQLQSGKRRFSCPIGKRTSSRPSKSEENGSRAKSTKSLERGEGDSEANGRTERETGTLEKQTQTPRNLPDDDLDPVLTDPAYVGKRAYEFLVLGEPITNELATKILVEYLKSFEEIEGWALVDYPNTYEQMSMLETALTGSKIPPDPEELDFEDDVTIEDVESLTPRIFYEDEIEPVIYRRSRLLPDPIERSDDVQPTTFAKLFVRVAQKPKNFELEDRQYETLEQTAPAIDKFYASRKIAYLLYYTYLDSAALKTLARLVIGERSRRKTSEELFGEAPGGRERVKEHSRGSKAPVVRRALPPPVGENLDDETAEIEEEEQDYARDDFQTLEFELRRAKPGEPTWQWVELPLPPALVDCLANLWLDAEETYVEDLKDALFLKSVHASGAAPYMDLIASNAAEFIKRPTNKQDLLHEFHMAFNEIDEDARRDADVKCELHRRVADFQAELWEICDQRRREAEEERKRFVADDWTVLEAMVLFNVYVGIVQVELDLCVDAIRLILDYYLGMLRKPLPETRFPKVLLNRMEIAGAEPVNFQERPAELSEPVDRSSDRNRTKRSKTKGGSPKPVTGAVAAPPPAADYELLRKEINDSLIDRNEPSREPEDVCVFRTILENVRYARTVVEALSAMADDVLKREAGAASKNKDFSSDSIDSMGEKPTASRVQDLLLEWRYAVAYEIDRIRLKLESIAAAARSEIVFLLDSMRRSFHRIYDAIVDRYWREMKSVNDMANVFCFAIEEAKLLENEMLLEDDRFVIRSNVFVTRVPSSKPAATVKEAESSSRFRIAQLARLMKAFRRVAPHGTVSRHGFVSILQDLASHGMEEGERLSLPCCWYRLRPTEISRLVDELFESADYVDWREFVVYAMDLPMPSYRDVLIARDRFRIQDPDLTEVVTTDQYLWTPLWFLECAETADVVYGLLRDELQRNQEELYEEEFYRFDRERYDATPAEQERRRSSISRLRTCCSNPEETLRLLLAKDLLCRMYAIDRRSVNYTALLLAFCKDEDPREGFAKALALALGTRVCTDVEEGERYVEELYEQRRVARRLQLSREASSREAREVTEEIIRFLLDKVDEGIGLEVRKRSLENLEETTPVTDRVEKAGLEKSSTTTSSLLFGESECKLRFPDQEVVAYWLSFDLCLTVLAAALPWHVLKPELFETGINLRDGLTFVYEELRDDDLNDQENVVLAHRLLHHEFTKRLLNSVSKFTVKNMGNMIREILRTRRNVKPA